MERSFTALVYRLAHPSVHHGPYRAECVQFPGLVGNGATPVAAVAALRSELVDAVRAGATETPGDAILTSITITPSGSTQPMQTVNIQTDGSPIAYTYTAVVTPDSDGLFAAFCPALGVASDGVSVDDALNHLNEAATLYLEDQPAPREDERVIIERVTLTLPDIPSAQLIAAQPAS